MKLTKLMLSACVAALALVSCNKEETTPVSENLKSVQISLANVGFATKGAGTTEKLDGTPITLNSLQLFFTDGTDFYKAKDASGNTIESTYYTGESIPTGTLSFHSLPASVRTVIAVGNCSSLSTGNVKTLQLQIANQQNPDNLALYDEVLLTNDMLTDASHDGENYNPEHQTKVYKVDIVLEPKVARLELRGVSYTDQNMFSSVELDGVAFPDYHGEAVLRTGNIVQNTTSSLQLTQTEIFNYFEAYMAQKIVNPDYAVWNIDAVSKEFTETGTDQNINLAYNFFPGADAYPRLIFHFTTTTNEGTADAPVLVDYPAYLTILTYRTSENDQNTVLRDIDFKAGYIYRMEPMKFSDSDLVHQDRCLDVNVTVAKWNAIVVYPSFR